MTDNNVNNSRIYKATAYLIFIVLTAYAILEARLFLYPIVIAVLFSYLLFPIANFLEKKIKIPRIIANLTSLVFAISVLTLLFFIVYIQFKTIMSDMPGIKQKIFSNINILIHFIETKTGVPYDNLKTFLTDSVQKGLSGSRPILGKIFSSTTDAAVRIGLLPVFVFFMLYYRDKAFVFLMMISKPEARKTVRMVIKQISFVTKRYMGGVFIVVLILCVFNSLGLYIIGLEYAIFFGIISAVCNFIPYFGTILGFSFPLIYALVTANGPSTSLGVIMVFVIIQFTENNILTPSIVGDNVKLNPFVIILSLILGAMAWGIPGMFVIVPLIAVLRIVFENIDKLKPYAYLIGTGGTEKHAFTFSKIKAIFKPKKNN